MSASFMVSFKLAFKPTPAAMVAKSWVFEYKIGYNSTCIGDM